MDKKYKEIISMYKKVAIIIVNWNGIKLLKKCSESIYSQTYNNFDVYFIDNGSIDNSIEFVKSNFPQIKIIQLDRNEGFAKANNIGIKKAFCDTAVQFVCTLNNDTQVDKNFLAELMNTITKNEKTGSVQAKLLFPDNRIQCAGFQYFPDLLGPDKKGLSRGFGENNLKYNHVEEIFAPTAAATLYRREMLEQIGLFDEDFFAYAEDLDLGLRAQLYGWKSFFCPTAKVIHYHSQTGQASSNFKAYHVRRNTNFVAIKNLPLPFLIKYLALSHLNYLKLIPKLRNKSSSAGQLCKKNNPAKLSELIFNIYKDSFKYLPKMIKKRRQILGNKIILNQELKNLFFRFKE